MIYFIQAGDSAIKIGFTKNITQRHKELQAGHYEKLKIICDFKGGKALEKKLHKLAKKYRIRGEWFITDVLRDSKIMNIANKRFDFSKKCTVAEEFFSV